MAIYNYKCKNKECSEYNKIIEKYIFNLTEILFCKNCNKELTKIFPLNVHVKGVGKEVDGKDLGKVTQEKNERLKKKWSGYSYEEQNLRSKINKMVEEKKSKK